MFAIFPSIKVASFIPKIFLGFMAIFWIIWSIPRSVKRCFPRRPKADSNPIIPFLALSNSTLLCSSSCGLWSVVITSIVPSFYAFINALLSFFVLNGGITLYLVSKFFIASSVKNKLWSATSAVIFKPFDFAFFIFSTLPLVLR